MARHWRRSWLVLIGVAVSVALAACGSSSRGSGGGGDDSSKGNGKPIVHVFGFGIETQPALGALFPPATYVATEPQVAAKAINASRSSKVQVQYTFCDTKAEAAGALTCARKAAGSSACGGSRCDVALETSDIDDNLSVPLLAKEGIPVVSATFNTPEAAQTPDDFGIVASETALQTGLATVMKSLGVHTVGILGVERPDVQLYNNAMASTAKSLGMTVSGQAVLPLSQVSPNSAIASVMSGGADGLMDAAVGNVGAALRYTEQSYPQAKIGMPIFMVSKGFFNGLADSVVRDVAITSWLQPVTATSIPGIKMFLAEGGLQAETSPYRGQDFATAQWLGMRFIGNVANTITGSVSPTSMLKALQTAHNIDMYGIMPPWSASQRGKNGAEPNTPYNLVVAGKLISTQGKIVADHPGVFINATTGKVAFVDHGAKRAQ